MDKQRMVWLFFIWLIGVFVIAADTRPFLREVADFKLVVNANDSFYIDRDVTLDKIFSSSPMLLSNKEVQGAVIQQVVSEESVPLEWQHEKYYTTQEESITLAAGDWDVHYGDNVTIGFHEDEPLIVTFYYTFIKALLRTVVIFIVLSVIWAVGDNLIG